MATDTTTTATASCTSIQQSLGWCEGKPEYAGIRRRLWYIANSLIVKRPDYPRDKNGRPTSAKLVGNFELMADAKWHYIDIQPDKSQLTSEAQGEYPSQTQLNKLNAVHPGVGPEATAAAAYINNNDNTYIVEDFLGRARVLGNGVWPVKSTVAQDNGQGATGTTSTTIAVEASDETPAPFYYGTLDTDAGEVDYSAAA